MKKLRFFVINYLTKHLLKAVTVEEILTIAGKDWLIGKRKLTPEERLLLKEEAQSFKESSLYTLIKKEIRYEAQLQRYDHAKTPDDMIFGKAMLWNFHLIDKFISKIISTL